VKRQTRTCPHCTAVIPGQATRCRFCGGEVEPPQRDLGEFLSKHLALVISVGLAGVLLLKLLAVSRFRPVTALTLLQAAGVSQVTMGVVLVSFPYLLWGIPVALFMSFGLRREDTASTFNWAVWLVLGLSAVPAALLSPWPFSVAVVVLVVPPLVNAFFTLAPRAEEVAAKEGSRSKRSSTKGWKFPLVAVLSVVILIQTLISHMWLPTEDLRLRSGTGIIGYVVQEEGGWTTILTNDTRSIVRIQSETLVSRRVCEVPSEAGLLDPVLDWTRSSPIQLILFRNEPIPKPCPSRPRDADVEALRQAA
jgi:hypothetical protein